MPYHKAKNEEDIKEFLNKYPFALLTGCDSENKPVATQIPVFMGEKDGGNTVRGHIMKNTDHHKAFLHNQNVLVVFSGPQTYVSGTWYSNPHTPSTWNYMSVHAKGAIRFLGEAALINILRKTTLHFENQNQQSTTIYDNLPLEYTKRLMKNIVAFEIEIKELNTVFKLSQDRNVESYNNIIKKLNQRGENAKVIAVEMEKRAKELFLLRDQK